MENTFRFLKPSDGEQTRAAHRGLKLSRDDEMSQTRPQTLQMKVWNVERMFAVTLLSESVCFWLG